MVLHYTQIEESRQLIKCVSYVQVYEGICGTGVTYNLCDKIKIPNPDNPFTKILKSNRQSRNGLHYERWSR